MKRSSHKPPILKKPIWAKAITTAANPQQARHFLELLQPRRLEAATAEQARIIAALLSGSEPAGRLLASHPEWLESLTVENVIHPRRDQGLRREMKSIFDRSDRFKGLREFKEREMLRIAARDLARLSETPVILREISDLADVCLSAALDLCIEMLVQELGRPYHQDAGGNWHPTPFSVVGLGKLGGQELNYSSDVDVIFVYGEEGHVFKDSPRKGAPPARTLPSHQFFRRLAESFVTEVGGMLYRVDLRLRPEGDMGPLARSLDEYENYYAQWGQTWERMMLIKARGVAGDAALASEFLELIQPFRFPRSLSQSVLSEVAAMKDRIEKEVVRAGEIDRDVKRGRGGIREIEFVVQTLQLLHAGRMPFLQGASTLPMLEKLVQYHLLEAEDAKALTAAYCFLRDVEHRLQMEHHLQTHTIPADYASRQRLARLMGFTKAAEFEGAFKKHRQRVRQVYDSVLKPERPEASRPLPNISRETEEQWIRILAEHGFRDPPKAFRLLEEFAKGPGYVHVSPRTVELAWELIPRFLALCPRPERLAQLSAELDPSMQEAKVLSDPDRVLTRLDTFITAYGTRAMLFEMWAHNPSLFELVLLLFDRSEFLAETAIRTPDLVDELVLSGRLRRRKSAGEILEDLRHGRRDEDQRLWIRRYHQTELMRIGLRDILGLADAEQNFIELTALADACLQYALEIILAKRKLKSAPLAIIGLGKLGGQEINYGSDLDIIFVAKEKTRNLPGLQRVALEVMDLLSIPTEFGVAFATDARLRPDGEKGLLVNTLDSYEDYYRRRAQLWEIQALTRVRPVAGHTGVGERFQRLAARLTDFRVENVKREPRTPGLRAYSPDWKEQIARMRSRIEKERTPPGQDALAIKTGRGGLIDAEFIAQTICLEHGWQEPNTLRALLRAQEQRVLATDDSRKLVENYRRLRRIEAILRRWSYEGETTLPLEPEPFYRVSVRCGFKTPEQFRTAVAEYRRKIRSVYSKYFGAA